ncbi:MULTISPECIES: hypothetical protein [Bradyrhizobium]|uniref:hypothetical protein n=1 Tax=Bradyrhizobium elkanii TaxID=29448 RepID=UPI0012BD55BC|nr:hypothetical protein [Bradyrhizobium elkanii]
MSIAHFLAICMSVAQNDPEAAHMETLVLQLTRQLTATFFEDVLKSVLEFGRSIARGITAPINRIANACDVAGVLERRRFAAQMRRRARQMQRPRGRWPFGSLSELT